MVARINVRPAVFISFIIIYRLTIIKAMYILNMSIYCTMFNIFIIQIYDPDRSYYRRFIFRYTILKMVEMVVEMVVGIVIQVVIV